MSEEQEELYSECGETHILENGSLHDLHEFCDILKYELALDIKTQSLIDTIHYLERRGFTIFKDHNV